MTRGTQSLSLRIEKWPKYVLTEKQSFRYKEIIVLCVYVRSRFGYNYFLTRVVLRGNFGSRLQTILELANSITQISLIVLRSILLSSWRKENTTLRAVFLKGNLIFWCFKIAWESVPDFVFKYFSVTWKWGRSEMIVKFFTVLSI